MASHLLTIVDVGNNSFSDIVTNRVEQPEFKCLQDGIVHELKFPIRDDNGRTIDNHGLPVHLVLEII